MDVADEWGLGRRMAAAERRADRQSEVVIQRLRLLSIVPTTVQLVVFPGRVHGAAYAALAVLLATYLWVWVILRADDRGSRHLPPAWTSIVGDVAVALLLMANYRTDPADAVQFIPLLMVVQAAARWGRLGGVLGGAAAGGVSVAWSVDVSHGAGLEVAPVTLGFRVVLFALVGLFVGLMVREARQQRRSAEAVITASRDLVLTFSLDGTIRSVNPAVERVLGFSPEDLLGRDRTDLLAPDERTFGPVAVDLYRSEGPQLRELRLLHRDGHEVWVEIDLLPDLEGGLIHAIGRDVSSRRAAESELRRRADHDGLTGVWNRQSLVLHLEGRLAAGARPGVVFIDLDRFKLINDVHGHLAGDRVLQEIAARLRGAVEGTGRVARYAGDEFCLVVDDQQLLEPVAEQARQAMSEPFLVGVDRQVVSASIGWAVAEDGDTPEALLHRADQSMYAAKDDQRD